MKIEQKFNILGKYKHPKLKLCKPSREGQGYLGAAYNLVIRLRFNTVSEMSFDINWMLDGKKNPLYDKILGGKVIYADQYGYFLITDAPIVGDGITEKKSVKAISAEYEIAKKKLNRVEDTIKLYNPLNATDDSTILGMFVKHNPRWKIGNVDSDLYNIYRTFDIQTSDWYNFLIKDVEEKFSCIFKFDNVNRVLHCYDTESAVKQTNIFISYNNLIDNIEIDEKYNEVFTALDCNGANYLDIRGVNPLGGNLIYNFKWYKNEDWMNKGLINKLTLWEEKIEKNQKSYKDILTSTREVQVKLTTTETMLVELEGKLKAVEQAMSLLLSSDANNSGRYNVLVAERQIIQSNINIKQGEISTLTIEIDVFKSQSAAISNSLSFKNNFTEEEIFELDSILSIDNYQNDAFAKTDIMTQYEIQDISQDLYDTSVKILNKICEPQHYFKASLVNFAFLKEYEKFTKQVDVGSVITVEVKKGWRAKVVLLSIELDFDNPTNFNMEFSNRYRLDNGVFEFTDLFSDNSRSSTNYNWDKMIIGEPVKSGKFTEVTNFINNSLDASLNALKSAEGIGASMDGSGIHLRKYIDDILQAREIWMTNNQIAMSSDNFNTKPSVAIGEFPLPNSFGTAWGINADFLAGKLIVGQQFIMEAEDGSFKFDGSGASLINAKLTVTDKSNIRRTLIDPDNGFKIQGRANPNMPWEDKIYLDNDGNAVIVGKFSAKEGDIGGFRIAEDGIYNDNNGDFWSSEGYGKFGLMEYNPNSATFRGNIYADNLNGIIPSDVFNGSSAKLKYLVVGSEGYKYPIRLFPTGLHWGDGTYINSEKIEDIQTMTIAGTGDKLILGTKYKVSGADDDDPTNLVIPNPAIEIEKEFVEFLKPTNLVWRGTQTQYNALTAEQKAMYFVEVII